VRRDGSLDVGQRERRLVCKGTLHVGGSVIGGRHLAAGRRHSGLGATTHCWLLLLHG
jgi:hypothetical protein